MMMPRLAAGAVALLLAALAVPLAAQRMTPPATASSTRSVQMQVLRDTTVVFEGGDQLRVTTVFTGVDGVEVCAANGPGTRPGKTLLAANNASSTGASLTTDVRYPGAGITPLCRPHLSASGDSIVVVFTRQVHDPVGRIGRLTVGEFRAPLSALQRKRIIFRWVRDGPDVMAFPEIPTAPRGRHP